MTHKQKSLFENIHPCPEFWRWNFITLRFLARERQWWLKSNQTRILKSPFWYCVLVLTTVVNLLYVFLFWLRLSPYMFQLEIQNVSKTVTTQIVFEKRNGFFCYHPGCFSCMVFFKHKKGKHSLLLLCWQVQMQESAGQNWPESKQSRKGKMKKST